MSSSPIKAPVIKAIQVYMTEDTLTIDLEDGRTLSAPLAWYPRLLHGTAKERNEWRLIAGGEGIHWPKLDEDISVQNLLDGKGSGESQDSLKQWLATRISHK